MAMSDPIADALTRIRNASNQRHDMVNVPLSKLKVDMIKILKENGFIMDYKITGEGVHKNICVSLKYTSDDLPVIEGIKRVSKPGRRVYVGKEEIPKVMGGMGIAILSTSQGLLTDREAKTKGSGGEVLCYVW